MSNISKNCLRILYADFSALAIADIIVRCQRFIAESVRMPTNLWKKTEYWKGAEKRPDAIGGKEEEPALNVVSWMNTQRSLPLCYRLPYLQ